MVLQRPIESTGVLSKFGARHPFRRQVAAKLNQNDGDRQNAKKSNLSLRCEMAISVERFASAEKRSTAVLTQQKLDDSDGHDRWQKEHGQPACERRRA
jgi:hypothetical protein